MQGDFFDPPGYSQHTLKDELRSFLEERLKKRLATAKNENKKQQLIDRFRYENWFFYAVKKLEKLRAATHVTKYSHSSASKAADLYSIPSIDGKHHLVGTHLFQGSQLQHDLSSPSGAGDLDADIKEFLRLNYDGKTIFERVMEEDKLLQNALSDDPSKARTLLKGLACITEPLNGKRAHPLNKQIYWLINPDPSKDQDFYLLSPLSASSLAHAVFSRINESRYGASAKEARKARQEVKSFEGIYHDYPNLVIQKVGGSNQQNVSQLNSDRNGQNYLLASLPPRWQSREVYAPMDEPFRAFKRRPDVWRTLDNLKRLLESDPAANMHTRNLRDDLTTMLVDELMLFTVEIHSVPAGWTTDERCRLAPEEQYWLDPGRADEDAEFAEARRQSDWHEEISARAARWLNRELDHQSPLNFGDVEHAHWKSRFDGVLQSFRRQLDDLQDALRDDDEDEGEAA